MHQTISKKIKTKVKLEDFDDCVDAINAAGVKSVRMQPGRNMLALTDGISKSKLKALEQDSDRPYLAHFKVIEAKAGSDLIVTKKELNQTYFRSYDLVKNNFDVTETGVGEAGMRPWREGRHFAFKDLAAHMMPHQRRIWEALVMNDISGSAEKKRKPLRQEGSKKRHQVISILLHSISCPLINDVAC